MLTNGLVALLLAEPNVSDIVGNRIQPIPAPEDLSNYPCVTYQAASYTPEYANEGSIGVSSSRIVFDCFALRYLDARTLALAVANVLSGYGVGSEETAFGDGGFGDNGFGGGTGILPDGTQVYLSEVVNMMDRFDDGSRIYCTSVHALIQYAD